MRNKFITLFMLILILGCNNIEKKDKKEFKDKIEELVLDENTIGKKYNFKTNYSIYTEEYDITYLGILKVKKNVTKVLYLTSLYGIKDSPQADSYLIFYDNQNIKLGLYYISSVEMPKIQSNGLFFEYKGGECNQTTTINFRDSIPKEIFINCTEKGGDFYKFEVK